MRSRLDRTAHCLGTLASKRSAAVSFPPRLFSLCDANSKTQKEAWEQSCRLASWVAGIFVTGGLGYLSSRRVSRPCYEPSGREEEDVGKIASTEWSASVHQSSSILATSAKELSVNKHVKENNCFDTVYLPVQHSVDFIIVGYGNTGRAAKEELMKKCPGASILVIDQHSLVTGQQRHSGGQDSGELLQHLTGTVVKLNHSEQAVDVITSGAPPLIQRIGYKHSILIASGARGAPPPEYLIDERAAERILEMKSTRNTFVNQYISHKHHLVDEKSRASVPPHLFPVLPAQNVRSIALMAASQGAKVCILGSDLEAVELAVALANRRKDILTTNNVCLMFGGAAPLGSMLPKYLSVAVTKRLKSHGIHVADRSLVRYISSVDNGNQKSQGRVEVFSAKSYDTMETNRYQADLVVVCPRVRGQQGNASIPVPTGDRPTLVYKPWSKMCPENNCVVSCFSDDGRILVNSELSAASKVFAAGPVAKYPNHDIGHATVAGEGILGGSEAGRIAASNMAKHYRETKQIGGDLRKHSSQIFNGIHSLPIERTDQVGYGSSELESLGIHALFVGACDSETMSTHGFWWTNQSGSLTRRRSKVKLSKREKMNNCVYGSGVVYYLDRAGAIRGIMLWGLPFTEAKDSCKINASLLDRIQIIIQSNGGVMQRDYRSIVQEMRLDPTRLSPFHLAEESRNLVSLTTQDYPGTLHIRPLSRPQHRFVPSKPISITKMGVLNKNVKIGNGGVGEDIFERNRCNKVYMEEGERARHPSLLHYFQYDWDSAQPTPVDSTSYDDVTNDYQTGDPSHSFGKYPELSARPPKEEQLWMRKGEMVQVQSTSDKLATIFMHNIKNGHFSDGSDAVKQAPVPQIVKDAKAWMTRRSGASDE